MLSDLSHLFPAMNVHAVFVFMVHFLPEINSGVLSVPTRFTYSSCLVGLLT